ncbi:hypothetical protein NGM10_04040 [Halorussus salilacus]|uniref:DUF7283 family protein n=1 Tax=Halorussus salilacus TaxID=2953750 RepID=UPI00209F7218|nr:hypothetical protein [Halorussus salilacus]USZ68911.1 hypothetical protein NGM10_04040 [Halorussus salilacus]
MFDAPVETWYLWVGLALASSAALGLAVSLPRAPPPDAAGVADTVDSVAASDRAATAVHPVSAEVRIGPYRVWLRDDGATGHATLAYGPVTPVRRGTALWDVLRGTPPESAFGSPGAFRDAAADARDRPPAWRTTGELTVRAVSWEGVDVTLVG